MMHGYRMRNPGSVPLPTATMSCLLLTVLMLAGSAQANVQVNQDPAGLDQNTTSVTPHPSQAPGPDILIVAYNDDPWATNGIGTSYSLDGGLTWFDSATQVAPVWVNNLDASVASDGAGAVFAGMSSFDFLPPNNMNSGIFVGTSFDGGQNFGPPVGVSVMTGIPGVLPWETKPKVDADNHVAAGSPFVGNAYVIWERDLPTTGWANAPSNGMFSYSLDQGATWSQPIVVNDNPGNDLVLWPDVDVGPDGSLAAAWLETPYWMQHQGQIITDRSYDGGVTFNPDVPAVTFWAVPQSLTDQTPMPGQQSYFAMSYPSVAVDPGNPSRIGIAFAADPDDGPAGETRVDTGDMPPSSWDATLLNPFSGRSNLSYGGTYLHAAWVDMRGNPPDVYYNRASLGGPGLPVWDTPDQLLSTQPWPTHLGANNVNIVSNFNNVHVAWDEWVGIDFANLIYYNGSHDDGASWLAQPVALDSHFRVCYEPWVTVDGTDHVVVAWLEDQLDGVDTDIYVNYSADGGNTWQSPEIQVPTTYRAFNHDIASIYDAASGTKYVYVVWAEETAGGSAGVINFSMSSTGGATWSVPVRLDGAPAGSELAYAPKICCEAGNVYVTWVDRRTGTEDIYFNWSANNGSSWVGELQLDGSGSRDYYSQIACGQGNVYVVYESDRNNLGANEDIIINFSVGSGSNWQGERRIDTGSQPGAAHSVYPRLTVGGGDGQPTPYVVWMDDRNGPAPFSGWDVYSNYSIDGGFTWPLDYRVHVRDQTGPDDSWYPHIDGPVACYLYRDERNGPGDLFGNVLAFGPDEGDVFYTESNDGGVTWLNPPLLVNDDGTWNDQTHPWVDIKPNGTVDVVWYDKRNDPLDRDPEVFFAAMLPGTMVFTPNIPISNQPIIVPGPGFWIGDYIGVAVDDVMAHVVWADNRREGPLSDAYYAAEMNPDPQEHGACCFPDDSCAEMTAADCAQAGGDYQGDGVPCDPNPCGVSGVGGDMLPGGKLCLVHPNYPNPFNPGTTIRYQLAGASPVRLTVYDLSGRVVQELHRSPLEVAGDHEVYWNGTDTRGKHVAAGVYLCRLVAGRETSTIRMALIK